MQISGLGENSSILSSHTMGGSVMASSSINSVLQAKVKRTGYHQKALAEIRNSLKPFANESSSVAQSSSYNGNVDSHGIRNGPEIEKQIFVQRQILQRLLEMGFDEDISIKAIEYSGGRSLQAAIDCLHKDPESLRGDAINGLLKAAALSGKIIRKPSFEHELCLFRGSPALDSSTASTRSDSPSVNLGLPSVSSPSQTPSPPRQYADPPHLVSQSENQGNFSSHVSRQYSPNFHEPPPPPPPPRNQAPPPTPPRGTTPPPPPRNGVSSQQYSYLPSSVPTNVQQILKRMSPVPPNNSKNQRGSSPVSFGSRQPIIVQNNAQVQHQITQQLQALNMYQSGVKTGPSTEPPPPYPLGPCPGSGALQNASKLSTPPPSYQASIQARQSPTQSDMRKVPSPAGIMYTQYAPVCSSGVSPTPRPATLQSLSARQAKTQPPIIMHSVKSTQVQKPILQTAVAPPCPPASSPPPSYNPSLQTKIPQQSPQCVSSYQQGDLSNFCSPVMNQSSPVFTHPTTVPTTDPPSYASTIQALAVQRGLTSQTPATNPACPLTSTTPVITTISSVLEKNTPNKIPLDKLQNGMKCQSDQYEHRGDHLNLTNNNIVNMNCNINNNLNCIKTSSDKILNCKGMSPRKLSPLPSDTASSASRSESPLSATASQCTSQSPVSFMSTTSTPSTQSESTQDSSTPSSRSSNAPYKTTHQSPIPERKVINKEKEEERRESRVRNYTPQAFKFYMEQHIENVLKSCQQRLHRRMQLENEMTKVGLSIEAQHQMRRMLSQKESNYIRLKRAKMDKSMFTKIKPIGVGAFGEVDLVRKIDTRHLYAMKILRKNNVLKRNQVAHVKAERDILAEADNEWVVKLYYSFQDKDNLYFVMDYIPGGDLMSLLIKLGVFQESLARFYIGELVCAIESVHKMGFTHRDIKPDNILIDRDGHIKLTDFGLCTGFRWTHNSKYYQKNEHCHQDSMEADGWTVECHCHDNKGALKPLERRRHHEHSRCLAHSLVGTPNYIAPEVLSRTGYTQLCDWWSVGVILYEMVVGQPPFLASSPAETQYKVINWKSTLKVPKQANLSPQSKDLILKLCTGPEDRLGKKGASEVKSHPFLSVLDYDKMRRTPAPYLPKITSPTDTSNFDPVDPDKLLNSDSSGDETSDLSGDKGKHPEHAFFEFTFRRFFDDGGHAYSLKLGQEDHDPQSPVYV